MRVKCLMSLDFKGVNVGLCCLFSVQCNYKKGSITFYSLGRERGVITFKSFLVSGFPYGPKNY